MRDLAGMNPAAAALYFLAAAGVVMFSMDPVIIALSLAGAVVSFGVLCGLRRKQGHLWTLALFLGMTLINPLVSHNGVTVLFVMNHNPVTLEALLFGAASAGMVAAVLYWFRCFSHLMTTDRLLYIFSRLSPKLALMLSMALRYVPLFGRQAQKINMSQKALGLYKEDNVADGFRGGMRVFSVMVTWALENGVVTADSMTARGYGAGRRTQFSLFRWHWDDVLLALASLLLGVLALWGAAARGFTYYPAITAAPLSARALAGYAAYALLAALPAIIQAKEAIKWRCLTSGI